MIFGAKFINPVLLQRVTLVLEKLGSKTCYVRITRTKWHFIVESSGMLTWASLDNKEFVQDLQLESKQDNVIMLELSIEHLSKAIKSVLWGMDVYAKLTKRNTTKMLVIYCKNNTTNHGVQTTVEQGIPVRILSRDEIERVNIPNVPAAAINIVMPNLASVRTVMDRMKGLGSHLTLRANRAGDLQLRVKTEEVEVNTQYSKLQIANVAGESSQASASSTDNAPNHFIEAMVDAKDFHRCLHVGVSNPDYTVCSLVPDHSVVMYAFLHETNQENVVTFYLPIKSA